MPLKAIVEGADVIGPDLSEEEWADLKLRHQKGLSVTMGCCGAPGHLRLSKKGTQHFYHAVDTGCSYAEESRAHLEIKYRIYRICQSENWETSVEYPAPDRTWISDVCATRNGRKVVFEVQISTLSPNELEDRDRRYQEEGIESYWLLDHFLGRSKDFESWYHSHLYGENSRPKKTVPLIDPSLFVTGPENHLFIPRGIRSIGLDAKNQTLFSTNNRAIPLEVWVREVLKGNYRNYLEETAAAYHRKRRLLMMAAPALIRFEDYYRKIIREKTYRKTAGRTECIFKTKSSLKNDTALQKKFRDLYAEIDWLENEYRLYVSESFGLFAWKKIPEYRMPRPYFRLESESAIRKLQECTATFTLWEESFARALENLEQGFRSKKR